MDNYEQKLEEQTTSKINSGMLINLRLNELWKDAHRHSRAGKYSQWNDDLDRVWCELGGDEKEIEKDDKNYDTSSDFEYNRLTKDYIEACSDYKKQEGFGKIDEEQRGSLGKQKGALIKKEIFLRRLQNKQGKGTAYNDNSADYMDD